MSRGSHVVEEDKPWEAIRAGQPSDFKRTIHEAFYTIFFTIVYLRG